MKAEMIIAPKPTDGDNLLASLDELELVLLGLLDGPPLVGVLDVAVVSGAVSVLSIPP